MMGHEDTGALSFNEFTLVMALGALELAGVLFVLMLLLLEVQP